MSAQRVSEQTPFGLHGLHGNSSRYFDAVGRPRKLAAGAMAAIQREFEHGIPTRELAQRYGVSTSLILQVCYFTPKGAAPKRPRPLEKRPVVMPADYVEIESESK